MGGIKGEQDATLRRRLEGNEVHSKGKICVFKGRQSSNEELD